MTNYSRSVLKSNGLRHLKNPPVKFSFSLKIVPATIAKKLPPQRCFKPLLIPIFNFPHKRPTFAFVGKSEYTLGFRRKIAHKGPPAETGGVSDGGRFYYPRSVPHVHEHPRAGCTPEGRRKPAGQRCAYACRCPEGVAAPLGCVIFLQFGDVALLWLSRRCLLYGVYCFRICRILRLLMTLHTFSRYF